MAQTQPQMCGITGVYTFQEQSKNLLDRTQKAIDSLGHRGPDNTAIFKHNAVALGHSRLSIIDTSAGANQPLTDPSGRFTIVFNGEIYNYRELKKPLEQAGIQFKTTSDTEVLLHLYIKEGEACLQKLNGFFAFCIYDNESKTCFIARDRMGIKPLLYSHNENRFVFGSEMKALIAYGVEKDIDNTSLYTYLQFNYIPAPATIFRGVKKLLPGHSIKIDSEGNMELKQYYSIPYKANSYTEQSYDEAQKQLRETLHASVKARMVADVPLGSFLSGGTDSSVIAAIARQYTDQLNTFSVGYADEPFYDETKYAKEVAAKIGAKHTVFSLSNKDLYDHLFSILDHIDEPFADSSAIAVNILSRETRKDVTVALSGDGADEIFSGYNKHWAEYKVRQKSLTNQAIKLGAPFWKAMPQSRQSKIGNIGRQLNKFASGIKLSAKDRYWKWASFMPATQASKLMKSKWDEKEYKKRRDEILADLEDSTDFNDVLYTDTKLVLTNDMLTKVDSMSMANSLEVRTPFLDHNVVELAFSIPEKYKIDGNMRKKVLQDAFRNDLPESLYNRPKKGFEVPLQKWFQTELKGLINDDLLADSFIEEQGIFNVEEVRKIKAQLATNSPGEATLNTWNLIVFQYWYKKYMIDA